MNQADLARVTGLHQSHISLLERGRRRSTRKTLRIIAAALGCDVDDLVRKRAA